jgi:magnesium transporter
MPKIMITHYFKTAEGKTLETLSTPKVGEWVHVVAPTEREFATLVEEYGLEDTIIEDIKDVFEVPRFEQEGTVAYFFTRYPYDVQDIDIDTAPILMILGESFLITIAQQEVPFLQAFIESKKDFYTTQKTKLFLEFMAELMVTYERKLTHTRKVVYRDMGRVRSIRGREIQRLVFLEQELNETISALVPTNDWFKQLTKGNYIQMFSEDREMLEDLLIDNGQLVDSAKSILKTIQNIRGASEAILTQSLNHTIRMLTAFTIILTIPTLIASLFGMNVPVPFQDNPFGFWFILGLIVVIVTVTIHFFSKNRWI